MDLYQFNLLVAIEGAKEEKAQIDKGLKNGK